MAENKRQSCFKRFCTQVIKAQNSASAATTPAKHLTQKFITTCNTPRDTEALYKPQIHL